MVMYCGSSSAAVRNTAADGRRGIFEEMPHEVLVHNRDRLPCGVITVSKCPAQHIGICMVWK